VAADPGLVEHLRSWRREVSRREGVPGFVILHDATIDDLCRLRPQNAGELLLVRGIGERKAERYGKGILEALRSFGK
jgi:ATP-dependent DNA helicase RecQ